MFSQELSIFTNFSPICYSLDKKNNLPFQLHNDFYNTGIPYVMFELASV